MGGRAGLSGPPLRCCGGMRGRYGSLRRETLAGGLGRHRDDRAADMPRRAISRARRPGRGGGRGTAHRCLVVLRLAPLQRQLAPGCCGPPPCGRPYGHGRGTGGPVTPVVEPVIHILVADDSGLGEGDPQNGPAVVCQPLGDQVGIRHGHVRVTDPNPVVAAVHLQHRRSPPQGHQPDSEPARRFGVVGFAGQPGHDQCHDVRQPHRVAVVRHKQLGVAYENPDL